MLVVGGPAIRGLGYAYEVTGYCVRRVGSCLAHCGTDSSFDGADEAPEQEVCLCCPRWHWIGYRKVSGARVGFRYLGTCTSQSVDSQVEAQDIAS